MPNSVIPLLCKNLLTGEIIRFKSISEASEKTGISGSRLRKRIGIYKNINSLDNLQFKPDDGSDWPKLSNKYLSNNGTIPVVIKDIVNNSYTIFNGIKEAETLLNISGSEICKLCKYGGKRPIKGRYIPRYLYSDIKWPTYTDKELSIYQYSQNNTLGITITDDKGKEEFFSSFTLAAQKYGIPMSSFYKIAGGRRKDERFNGYIFEIYDVNKCPDIE